MKKYVFFLCVVFSINLYSCSEVNEVKNISSLDGASTNFQEANRLFQLAEISFQEEFDEGKFSKTIELLKKSENLGLADAQLGLAIIYWEHSLEKNYTEAMYYLEKAANNEMVNSKGYPVESVNKAQIMLAGVYKKGLLGQKKNKGLSRKWLRKALEDADKKLYGYEHKLLTKPK